jgi:hypothetical protein
MASLTFQQGNIYIDLIVTRNDSIYALAIMTENDEKSLLVKLEAHFLRHLQPFC